MACGLMVSLLTLGVQAIAWKTTHGLERAFVTATLILSILTIVLTLLAWLRPSKIDLDRLAQERVAREAERAEKERHLQLRHEEVGLRKSEAETRKLQAEASRAQLLFEEERRRIERNARERARRRRQKGLPPEALEPVVQLSAPQAAEEEGESALDLILSDDDESV